ncbi:hypothetical protein A2Z67_05165 [Candidatus Woesebacteria bacterium RBG_13_36_22]|uniref:Uncharacterized protein n=1 Tax=Candidatus Woesebacteria bacterium RBG_13_36_22 TaxID=1802478 RepID=A0A1F7X2J0_9BACT|nr:MAG: hypothetical protein A2Z67_05165 [Candidatus Woesebacteria bacterium RBG_13_36_22]
MDTIRIISLEMENFLSVKSKTTLNLGNRGLVLVEGLNGSGKSACFVDALCYGIYGKTTRGVSKDDVVNRFFGRNSYVGLKMISSDDDLIEIDSYRKHSKYKDNVFFKINGKPRLGSTNDHTRDLIVKYLDMDFTAFTNSVVFGQSMAKYFSGLTDSEQKKVVDRLLGITWIPEAWDAAKKDLSDLEKEQIKIEVAIGTKNTRIQMKEDEIVEQEKKFKDFEFFREENIQKLREELGSLKVLDTQQIEDEISILDKKISEINEQIPDDLTTIQDDLLRLNLEKGQQEGKITYKKADIELLTDSIYSIKDKIGTTCSSCGQEIKEEFAETHKDHLENEKSKLIEEKNQLEEKLKDLNKQYFDMFNRKEELVKLLTQADELIKVKNDLEKRFNLAKIENVRISTTRQALENEITRLSLAENPHNADKIREDLANFILEKSEEEEKLSCLQEEIKYYAFWVSGFSNAGVKSLIIESMIPQMNGWASTYSSLFDNKFDIKFSAQTKLKKGDLAEKFDVMAFNKIGAEVYDGNSGGEKRVIDVIVMFVLGDLASSRSSKRFSILVLDEVFERLDEEICDRVIQVLKSMIYGEQLNMELQLPKRESIFVLTHLDYFKSKFENRIQTRKENDETRIYDGG